MLIREILSAAASLVWSFCEHAICVGWRRGRCRRGARDRHGPGRRGTVHGPGSGLRPGGNLSAPWLQLGRAVGDAELYSFDATRIAAAAYSDDPKARVERDGSNTAVVLAALKLGNEEQFDFIESAMRSIVPSFRRIRQRPAIVERRDAGGPVDHVRGTRLAFDFDGASDVLASGASRGTLVTLALLTVLLSPDRPNLILLDDLDHALHPRAQKELMQTLLRLMRFRQFADLQIVATTHSPYILDEVEPSSVRAFALRDDGTVAAKSLAEHPDATKMSGVLTAGQLWTPNERPHELTARHDHDTKSVKRVLTALINGDHEREARCWLETPSRR